jgi:hypothetical protein
MFRDVHSELDLFILNSKLELLQYVLDEFAQRERLEADLDIG